MPSWPSRVIRAFGIVGILVALFGLDNSLRTIVRYSRLLPRTGEAAFHSLGFYVMTTVNILCLLALIVGSVGLLRVSERGRVICNVVFAFEILYFTFEPIMDLFLSLAGGKAALIGDSFSRAGGTGNMGLVIQLISGYPVIALVAINVAYRKLRREKRRATSHADLAHQ